MKRVSFLGYGRFGAALGAQLEEQGLAVRAFDTAAPVPERARVSSLSELVRGADLVVVALPVSQMRAAFEALRPLVTREQTVIDVGSVKTGPARDLAEVLGAERPWVATHPLFGPVSLARGERPLRAVVCPNVQHPSAVRRVTALFEQIGCEVMHFDPDEHDRAMAFTHALAFFVAKGMLDAGVPTFAPYAPPSFQSIAHSIELVRGDAGHLFATLHCENPHATAARRRLLEALSEIDRDLARAGEPRDIALLAPSLSIPDLGDRSPSLRATRELIDELDHELVELLARRAELSRRAASAKAELGHAVRDPDREARMLEERRSWATACGLDPPGVEAIFRSILDLSRRLQEQARSDDP
ncbi:MAG: prephenate dehydrogenase/arogenate dehydrogenase family protein [Polyangiaceae bacterium]